MIGVAGDFVLFQIKDKHVLEVTPIYWVWTLLMGYCFMYSFALRETAPDFYAAIEIFRWLYVVGLLLLFASVTIREDRRVTLTEIADLTMWTFIGLAGLGFTNVFVTLWAKSSGLMSVSELVINTAAVDDLLIALLAGYNEEIAFAAIYYIIYRFVPEHHFGIPKSPFRISLSHVLTLFAVVTIFPLWHSVAYPNLFGPVFIVLFLGRLILTEIMVRSKRIEPSIQAHAFWDILVMLPALFVMG